MNDDALHAVRYLWRGKDGAERIVDFEGEHRFRAMKEAVKIVKRDSAYARWETLGLALDIRSKLCPTAP